MEKLREFNTAANQKRCAALSFLCAVFTSDAYRAAKPSDIR
jgi:hypothetical protein